MQSTDLGKNYSSRDSRDVHTGSLWKMMILASILAAVFNLAGLALAWMLDLPPGAVIILIAAFAYAVSLIIERVRSGAT